MFVGARDFWYSQLVWAVPWVCSSPHAWCLMWAALQLLPGANAQRILISAYILYASHASLGCGTVDANWSGVA